MDRNFVTVGCAICVATCGLVPAAHAASQQPAVFEDVAALRLQPVDDAVLATQTGKGLAGDIISGVVVSLLSEWHAPNGATAVASGAISIVTNTLNQVAVQLNSTASVSGPGTSAASVANSGNSPAAVGSQSSSSGSGTSNSAASVNNPGNSAGSGANPNAIATGGQNVSVNGVSQITQIAGNGNAGSNQTVVDFDSAAASSLSSGSYNNSASASASNANGSVKAGITFGTNGVSVSLQTPAGVATQSVLPAGNAQQASTIAQLLQIAGNNQQVVNQLQLHLLTQPMSANMVRQLGVLQALQNAPRR